MLDVYSSSSSTANRHFLRAMARTGSGYSEFFDARKKSCWERKVKDQLHRAFQPAMSQVNIEWWQFDDDAPKPVQVMLGLVLLLNAKISSKQT